MLGKFICGVLPVVSQNYSYEPWPLKYHGQGAKDFQSVFERRRQRTTKKITTYLIYSYYVGSREGNYMQYIPLPQMCETEVVFDRPPA